ncbi:hypothetical protein BDY21DRAFT_346836 [Lineolata rhizophorae]|uniref:Secreted protein n=1 Tax=Lineolata rhizophorae TaxID=578093 RepID=A0A6A6NX63_9PEZI|nr:hypothetical protein BDY21DRAFT_346836 [Lineolata rhizophorae]
MLLLLLGFEAEAGWCDFGPSEGRGVLAGRGRYGGSGWGIKNGGVLNAVEDEEGGRPGDVLRRNRMPDWIGMMDDGLGGSGRWWV